MDKSGIIKVMRITEEARREMTRKLADALADFLFRNPHQWVVTKLSFQVREERDQRTQTTRHILSMDCLLEPTDTSRVIMPDPGPPDVVIEIESDEIQEAERALLRAAGHDVPRHPDGFKDIPVSERSLADPAMPPERGLPLPVEMPWETKVMKADREQFRRDHMAQMEQVWVDLGSKVNLAPAGVLTKTSRL